MASCCQEAACKGKLAVVCLGCAGMVGLEEAVRGGAEGKKVRIMDAVVDGVKAGVGMLMALARGTF